MELLTTEDVAAALKVPIYTVQRVIRLGYLKCSRLPGVKGVRVHPDDFNDYLERYSTGRKKR